MDCNRLLELARRFLLTYPVMVGPAGIVIPLIPAAREISISPAIPLRTARRFAGQAPPRNSFPLPNRPFSGSVKQQCIHSVNDELYREGEGAFGVEGVEAHRLPFQTPLEEVTSYCRLTRVVLF
jgi:hypothetical protein